MAIPPSVALTLTLPLYEVMVESAMDTPPAVAAMSMFPPL